MADELEAEPAPLIDNPLAIAIVAWGFGVAARAAGFAAWPDGLPAALPQAATRAAVIKTRASNPRSMGRA
jgi:hypothetical protein